jgi:hypothetical protein
VITRISILIFAFLMASESFAQSRRFGGFGGGRGGAPFTVDRGNVPMWDRDPFLPHDSFMWARLKYRSWTERRSWTWYTDFPDSDLNMSYRLHQLTAMKVDPEGVIIEITDPRLFDYPFYYVSGVGGLTLDKDEAAILRKYMFGGGFLFFDDFHGQTQWDGFYKQMKKVFPDREPIDLPLDHQIFHIVYDLKEKYQVPNISIGTNSRGSRTWEEQDWKDVHYCAFYDDKGRMVAFISHNSDLGDGWEEEATDPFYFQTFSEPMAYPIGFNVIVYALTH